MVISTLVNAGNKCRMEPELLHAIMLECKSTSKGQVSQIAKHLVTYANYRLFQQLALGPQVQHGSLQWVRDALPHRYILCTLQANNLPSSHGLLFQNSHLHILSCLYYTEHLSEVKMMRTHILSLLRVRKFSLLKYSKSLWSRKAVHAFSACLAA